MLKKQLTGQQKGKPHEDDFLSTKNETIRRSPMISLFTVISMVTGYLRSQLNSQLHIESKPILRLSSELWLDP